MRAFTERWLVSAWLGILLACGGLAEDGPSPSPLGDGDPAQQQQSSELVTARPAAPAPEAPDEEARPTRGPEQQEALAGSSRVGQACGPLDADTPPLVLGDVQLQQDARCGAGNTCLMRSPAATDCRASSSTAAVECTREGVDLIPVPPLVSPEPVWQQNVCTCRCDGNARDADYCSCPSGMRCELLIPSSGANAAARPYVGSYCVL
ncbi:MAG TPA: hypothetical protein VFS67_05495 [Polyangiaceae bacterium]|jgi:hypothetical protein|nr:hypothetical protein [Polyangiaceae bacterium]